MVDENIHLKNRLSEILSDQQQNQLLNEIEDYQTRFLKIDELIRILRNDVAELEQSIKEKQDTADNPSINNKLSRIRLNIPLVERQLERMKMDFNSFLLIHS
jgi:chromosome segregation ATPase